MLASPARAAGPPARRHAGPGRGRDVPLHRPVSVPDGLLGGLPLLAALFCVLTLRYSDAALASTLAYLAPFLALVHLAVFRRTPIRPLLERFARRRDYLR